MAQKRNTTTQNAQKANNDKTEISEEVTLEQALAEEADAESPANTSTDDTTTETATEPKPDPDAGYTIIVEKGEAEKISPKASGLIFYQIARKDDDNQLYVRIDSNEGGGLHSREWVALADIIELLEKHKSNHFSSTILKAVIVGKSSNNTSFMAGILRSKDVALIEPSPEGIFLHRLVDNFDEQTKALLAMS